MIRYFLILMMLTSTLMARWQVREGRYATVEFTPGYETLADSMLNISERVLPRLCALHGVDINDLKEKKTRIILTDAPDVTNGFAVENNVVIFVRSSSFMRFWSGPFTWYNLVLEHELAHHVTFRAIWRKSNYFGQIGTLTVPRWFFEGIAQYFAESWTPFRGDIYLKEEVINGRFDTDDLSNLQNGRLLYAAGHAYIRYLASTYGDSSLIKLMRYEKDGFFYDFDDAFEQVYGKSPDDLFPWFVRHLTLHYGHQLAAQPDFKPEKLLPSFGYRDISVVPLAKEDSLYLARTVLKKNHLYTTGLIARVKKGEVEITEIISDDLATEMFVSADERYVAYGRHHLEVKADQAGLSYDWFVYDRNTGQKRRVATRIRAVEAAFDPEQRLILSVADGLNSYLIRYDRTSRDTLLTTENSLGQIRSLKDGALMFESQSGLTAQRDLFLWRAGIIRQITDDSLEQRNFFPLDEQTVLHNTMLDNHAAVVVSSDTMTTLIHAQQDVWLQGYDARSHTMVVKYARADGNSYFTVLSPDSLRLRPLRPHRTYVSAGYDDWMVKKARAVAPADSLPFQRFTEKKSFPQGTMIHLQSLIWPLYDPVQGAGLFFSTAWMEALQRQLITANVIYMKNPRERFATFYYRLLAMNLEWSAAWYHGPVIFPFEEFGRETVVRDALQAGVAYARHLGGQARWPYRLELMWQYDAFDGELVPDVAYQKIRIGGQLMYRKRSAYAGVIPKRQAGGSLFADISLDGRYPFRVWQGELFAGSNLISEKVGVEARGAWVRVDGTAPYSTLSGIDRFYSYDLPRDVRYTRSVRGFSGNLLGNSLLWSSVEARMLLASRTGLTALFLPINNLAGAVFADGARVKRGGSSDDVYSWGGELSFGEQGLRFGAGWARSYLNGRRYDQSLYLRLRLDLTAFGWQVENLPPL
ncbi:MAG TPA: hypothetical protein ENJ10_10180 [Caldithrix abyssi]|uniref:Bacterial surface antigen (D15) domain-containing protein n=1 Tax=Caldithrix abyssi TaxID=187145 RepID=A0A7V1LN51_CALAY|nr:hypothetical protein [Caldithrix abyssi]